MKTRRTLLKSLLNALVDEWGRDEVAAALASTAVSPGGSLANNATSQRPRPSREHVRPSATAQVEQATVGGERKGVLLQLADRYDRRQFLPSVADVRQFLIMMDERPVAIKDRREAFRVLLQSLIQLPVERLQHLSRTAQHSGPSELGPLSDAISAVGERLPRHRHANAESQETRIDRDVDIHENRIGFESLERIDESLPADSLK